MWKNLKFSVKMTTLAAVFMLFTLIIIAGYHYMSTKIRDIGIENASAAMLTGYRDELKDIVDYTAVALGNSVKNISDEAEKIKTLSTYIDKARFFPDQSGYMFIYKRGVNVLLPPNKKLQGRDLINLKDAGGKLLIQELFEQASNGGGFVDYLWEKPGSGVEQKLSYARMIPHTEFWIGTGVYVDDVAKKETEIKSIINDFTQGYLIKIVALLVGILVLVIIPLTILMIRSMVIPLNRLTETAQEYSLGKLDRKFEDDKRGDELGKLAISMKLLGTQTKKAMATLQGQG